MTILSLVTNDDDWSAFYINGELQHQGHSVPFNLAIELCVGHTITQYDIYYSDFFSMTALTSLSDYDKNEDSLVLTQSFTSPSK